jgi:hypothetical protein
MIEDIKTFYSNNTTMVILVAVALIAMLGIFMFKSSLFKKTNTSMDMAMGGMDGMGEMGSMGDMAAMGGACDSATGMCHPHAMMNMTPPMTMEQPMMTMEQSSTNDSSNYDSNNNSNYEDNNDNTNYEQ